MEEVAVRKRSNQGQPLKVLDEHLCALDREVDAESRRQREDHTVTNRGPDGALSRCSDQHVAGAIGLRPSRSSVHQLLGAVRWHRTAALTGSAQDEQRGRDQRRRETDCSIAAIEEIPDPSERLAAVARCAYERAARGIDPHAAVLAAAADRQIGPVLERVTEKRLAFLERLYRDLGLPSDEVRRRSRLSYALYFGIGALRQAAPGSEPAGPDLDAYLDLAIRTLLDAARLSAGGRPGGSDEGGPGTRPETESSWRWASTA